MNGLESQIVQGAAGLLTLTVTLVITMLTGRAKRWISAHSSAKAADVATTVIDGLGSIAEAVVSDFNQRVVTQAKAAGTWTPALAASVKADAIRAVADQGGQLVALGQSVVGNMSGLVSSLVEGAVARSKYFSGQSMSLTPAQAAPPIVRSVTVNGPLPKATDVVAQQMAAFPTAPTA